MKVIDLLNKIANGEEVPKKIRVNDINFDIYTESPNIDYQLENGLSTYLFQDYIHSFGEISLNDEIEIIEEDKKIEKLDKCYSDELEEYVVQTYIDGNHYKEIYKSRYDEMMINKINELIDEVNKLNCKED